MASNVPGLPSIVQSLYDSLGPGAEGPPLRLILCGSAISVMADLLSGTRALRGRAALDLRVRPFGYRDAREHWRIGTPAAAFAHNAIIGGLLGRPATSLAHQLATLAAAGFIDRSHDLLLDRRPVVTVADPMVRFHQLVIEPYLADLEAGRASQVWAEAAHTVESKIYGPHFEAIAAEWTGRYSAAEAGLAVGPVGQTIIACREHRTGHEIDVLALARGTRPRTPGAPSAFIGEARHRDRRAGLAELRRLQHLRELLTAAGHDASDAVLGLFSATGFTGELRDEAAGRQDGILLASLDTLYGQPIAGKREAPVRSE